MSTLLRRLQTESFLLTLRDQLAQAPVIEGYGIKLIDDHTIEVEISKDQGLNDIFAALSGRGIEVLSLRNKVNRLEEMFMRLVENRQP
jgi:ABC-2 type transport system ATP-binding protein